MNAKEIKEIINEIEDVSDLFYMQKNNEAYGKLEIVLVRISKIIDDTSMNIDVNKMNEILLTAMNAMETKDCILLADILKYDITEQLNTISDLC